MSKLREQLIAAKQEHSARQYPGDLMADLPLPIARPMRWLGWPVLLGGALAAAMMIAFALYHPAHPADVAMVQKLVVPESPSPSLSPSTIEISDEPPSLATDISIAPGQIEPMKLEYQSFSFPDVPSFPSLELIEQSEEHPTTQPESA